MTTPQQQHHTNGKHNQTTTTPTPTPSYAAAAAGGGPTTDTTTHANHLPSQQTQQQAQDQAHTQQQQHQDQPHHHTKEEDSKAAANTTTTTTPQTLRLVVRLTLKKKRNNNNHKILEYALANARLRVGRGASCDIAFPTDDLCSSTHCIITKGQLVDKGSTNGTFINQIHIPTNTPYTLKHGDIVTCGASHMYILHGEPYQEAKTPGYKPSWPPTIAPPATPPPPPAAAAANGAAANSADGHEHTEKEPSVHTPVAAPRKQQPQQHKAPRPSSTELSSQEIAFGFPDTPRPRRRDDMADNQAQLQQQQQASGHTDDARQQQQQQQQEEEAPDQTPVHTHDGGPEYLRMVPVRPKVSPSAMLAAAATTTPVPAVAAADHDAKAAATNGKDGAVCCSAQRKRVRWEDDQERIDKLEEQVKKERRKAAALRKRLGANRRRVVHLDGDIHSHMGGMHDHAMMATEIAMATEIEGLKNELLYGDRQKDRELLAQAAKMDELCGELSAAQQHADAAAEEVASLHETCSALKRRLAAEEAATKAATAAAAAAATAAAKTFVTGGGATSQSEMSAGGDRPAERLTLSAVQHSLSKMHFEMRVMSVALTAGVAVVGALIWFGGGRGRRQGTGSGQGTKPARSV